MPGTTLEFLKNDEGMPYGEKKTSSTAVPGTDLSFIKADEVMTITKNTTQ